MKASKQLAMRWFAVFWSVCLVGCSTGGATSSSTAATAYAWDIEKPAPGYEQDAGSPATQPTNAAAGVDVPILMYHYLTDGAPSSVYDLSKDLFGRQIAAMAAYGYQTVSVQDFLAYRSGEATPPGRPVILTFDDGHRGVYDAARPLLIAAGMRATLCIPTGSLGESPAARKGSGMVWNPEILDLHADGFPIQSHSLTHPFLTQISQSDAWQEIKGSQTLLQERLGSPVTVFCYPYGDGAHDASVRALVQQAGYRAAVATWPAERANTATSDIFALPRFLVSEANSVELDQAHPEHFFMRMLDPAFPIPLIDAAVAYRPLDAATGACSVPDETITVVVTATNRGSPAEVWVTLSLDDDADHASVYYRKSQKITLTESATSVFTYTPDLSDGRRRGIQYAAVDIQDERQVLGYWHSGFQPLFMLADACQQVFLPAIHQ